MLTVPWESRLEAVVAVLEQRDNLHVVSSVFLAREPQELAGEKHWHLAGTDWICELKEKDSVESKGTRRI